MKDSNEVMEKFMKDLENGKFVKETNPNPPPHYDGNNEDILKNYTNFLNSDLNRKVSN